MSVSSGSPLFLRFISDGEDYKENRKTLNSSNVSIYVSFFIFRKTVDYPVYAYKSGSIALPDIISVWAFHSNCRISRCFLSDRSGISTLYQLPILQKRALAVLSERAHREA
jgi:hypothetical protein